MKLIPSLIFALPALCAAAVAEPAALFAQAQKLQQSAKSPEDFAAVAALYQQAVDGGHAGAAGQLALLYTEGQGVPQDFNKVFALFSFGAKQGDAQCLHGLGICYSRGVGGSRDPQKTLHYVQLAAEQGFAKSLHALSSIYLNGEGVKKDESLAFDYAQRAAAQKYPPAYTALCLLYRQGVGCAQDAKKAIHYAQMAIEGGEAEAYSLLGDMYLKGDIVPKDEAKGLELLHKGVALNDPQSLLILGYHYVSDTPSLDDNEQGLAYIERSAAMHYAKAFHVLGDYYIYGRWVNRDVPRGVELLKKAHQMGALTAASDLAYCYLEFFDNPEAALPLAQEAHEFGDLEGSALLGWMYRDGLALPQDVAKGVAMIQEAAANKHKVALYLLAECYELGLGVPKNNAEALRLFREAAPIYNQAYARIARVLLAEGKVQEALAELKIGEREEAASSYHLLSQLHQHGLHGFAKNPVLAYKYHLKALMNGDDDARILNSKSNENTEAASELFDAKHYAQALALLKDEQMLLPGQFVIKGVIYSYEGTAVHDEAKAIDYLKIASEMGNYYADYNLAIIYKTGSQITPNPEECAKYLKKAIGADPSVGLCHLYAECLEEGFGFEKNLAEARRYLQMAADKGDGYAEFSLARLYYQSAEFKANPAPYLKHLEAAARAGYVKANVFLTSYYVNAKQYDLVYQFAKQGADAGDPDCLSALAACYYHGLGVEQNLAAAQELWEFASKQGHEASTQYLKENFPSDAPPKDEN